MDRACAARACGTEDQICKSTILPPARPYQLIWRAWERSVFASNVTNTTDYSDNISLPRTLCPCGRLRQRLCANRWGFSNATGKVSGVVLSSTSTHTVKPTATGSLSAASTANTAAQATPSASHAKVSIKPPTLWALASSAVSILVAPDILSF